VQPEAAWALVSVAQILNFREAHLLALFHVQRHRRLPVAVALAELVAPRLWACALNNGKFIICFN